MGRTAASKAIAKPTIEYAHFVPISSASGPIAAHSGARSWGGVRPWAVRLYAHFRSPGPIDAAAISSVSIRRRLPLHRY
jgi:hypothetical protein